jgi:hypothetical protein
LSRLGCSVLLLFPCIVLVRPVFICLTLTLNLTLTLTLTLTLLQDLKISCAISMEGHAFLYPHPPKYFTKSAKPWPFLFAVLFCFSSLP